MLNRFFAGAAALIIVAAPAATLAEDLTFTLTNSSSQALVQFFTSPSDTDTWQEDVFGDGVLPSGNTVDVNVADGSDQCLYDMKFVMEDGEEYAEAGVDLCELGEYTLTDE